MANGARRRLHVLSQQLAAAAPSTLVIGGSGPTGQWLVEGLLQRGHVVTMMHSGAHKPSHSWYNKIEKIYANVFDEKEFTAAVKERHFDNCFCMYGRLRMIANAMVGRCTRFLSVGGIPVYRGFAIPDSLNPPGLPVPQREHDPKNTVSGDLMDRHTTHPNSKVNKIIESEQDVFHFHPTATHFRYPWIYGPDQGLQWEWSVVRRCLDKRPFMFLPDNGLALVTRGYGPNVAHTLLLAIDKPEVSKGQTFNVGDEHVATLRQWVEMICEALGSNMKIVSIPHEYAVPCRPLLKGASYHHEVFDCSKAVHLLGYRDVVPTKEALALTARTLAADPPPVAIEKGLQDVFDYAAEDALLDAWQRGDFAAMRMVQWKREPGFTGASYGMETNPYDGMTQEKKHEGKWDPVKGKRVSI